jgi:phosphohistidine phosphatase SixA
LPGSHPQVAARQLANRGESVLVVGHEPSISALGALLLGRPSFPPFRTAQACAIENGAPTFAARADIGQVHALFVD